VRIFFGLDDSNQPALRCMGLRLRKGERDEKKTLRIYSLDNLAGCHSFPNKAVKIQQISNRELLNA
jgi:hypothetical protein